MSAVVCLGALSVDQGKGKPLVLHGCSCTLGSFHAGALPTTIASGSGIIRTCLILGIMAFELCTQCAFCKKFPPIACAVDMRVEPRGCSAVTVSADYDGAPR